MSLSSPIPDPDSGVLVDFGSFNGCAWVVYAFTVVCSGVLGLYCILLECSTCLMQCAKMFWVIFVVC